MSSAGTSREETQRVSAVRRRPGTCLRHHKSPRRQSCLKVRFSCRRLLNNRFDVGRESTAAAEANQPLLAGVDRLRKTTFFGLADRLLVSGYGRFCRSDTVSPKVQKCSTWSSPFSSSSPMANLKSLHIPRPTIDFSSTATADPTTPKTPADEGIEFFELALVDNKAPIRIYELSLDPDGGPNKDRAVWFLLTSRKLFLTPLSFHSVRAIASGDYTLCLARHNRRWNTRLQEWRFQNQLSTGWRSFL